MSDTNEYILFLIVACWIWKNQTKGEKQKKVKQQRQTVGHCSFSKIKGFEKAKAENQDCQFVIHAFFCFHFTSVLHFCLHSNCQPCFFTKMDILFFLANFWNFPFSFPFPLPCSLSLSLFLAFLQALSFFTFNELSKTFCGKKCNQL